MAFRPADNPRHTNSWYAASAKDKRVRPALDGEIETDVCVVGAGFTGISGALELAERGYSVVVLEAERIGFGASGRNGGQIVNGYSRDLDTIAGRYGRDKAVQLGAMSLEGGEIIRSRVAKYGIDCDLVDGGFFAAFTDKQIREMAHHKADWERYGHGGLEMVSKAEVGRYVKTDRYAGGMIDRLGGHIHPLNLVIGEAAAFENLGGRIFEGSRVIGLDTGEKPVARTEKGSVKASYVLVCGNAYLSPQFPEISGRMMPVSSQVMATEPLDASLIESLLPANYCVEDANYILDYYRRTADNRLLYGGGIGYGGNDPSDLTGVIRPNMLKTFPQLKGVKIDYAWSGNFALTLTRIPHVGKLSDKVYFSHGDSGHGVTTTHLLGKILGEAVAGHAERFDIWSSLPNLPFPGGQTFRVPLTVLGAWWYGLRDRLGL
ncbi:Gamma-glutamylputrescine oxidoreductase [Neorhizobium galegae bv. officinalis bv. officinalis str. HAMBI 1141]|uniref:Gamma-glutamylputrescine oxidoreductase n=1 Tax=Neorhizobium galegae bv. officinalis bv. officinalis str. HAMBI 1141 TaxID=1028801 RepID=A0A068T3P2_NEOGA|nr:FAD-binding oxidoreductase [Neorhizobium galegae]CDN52694.1 Gamma-glutamylputrescine oxidoreductase [Neorhizobium galegae bv. officinalis bv. officinalis str. HAMBI 1141]